MLEQYRRAFSSLNASGLDVFWPTVKKREVERAFGQLERQTFEFDSCSVDVNNASTATAVCSGRATFTPRIGGRVSQTESRRWMFRLERAERGWIIESVNSR